MPIRSGPRDRRRSSRPPRPSRRPSARRCSRASHPRGRRRSRARAGRRRRWPELAWRGNVDLRALDDVRLGRDRWRRRGRRPRCRWRPRSTTGSHRLDGATHARVAVAQKASARCDGPEQGLAVKCLQWLPVDRGSLLASRGSPPSRGSYVHLQRTLRPGGLLWRQSGSAPTLEAMARVWSTLLALALACAVLAAPARPAGTAAPCRARPTPPTAASRR